MLTETKDKIKQAFSVICPELILTDEENGSSDVGITGSVTSEKEGDLQRSYGDKSASFDMLDKTYYGIEFKRLRSMCVVPIVTRWDNAL